MTIHDHCFYQLIPIGLQSAFAYHQNGHRYHWRPLKWWWDLMILLSLFVHVQALQWNTSPLWVRTCGCYNHSKLSYFVLFGLLSFVVVTTHPPPPLPPTPFYNGPNLTHSSKMIKSLQHQSSSDMPGQLCRNQSIAAIASQLRNVLLNRHGQCLGEACICFLNEYFIMVFLKYQAGSHSELFTT